MPACSGTDIAAGIEDGIRVFNDPANPSRSPGGRVIVLVSDGEPNADSKGSHPTLNNTQLLTLAQQRADDAWADGIHLYVVFFNQSNDAAAAAKLRTLARGKGDFVQVTDAALLPAALRNVTKRLPLRLVR
jgi:nitric oxide reductase activation protein